MTDKQHVLDLAAKIKDISTKPLTIMEVCGTHTMSIYRYGLRGLLPAGIQLVSGPGCPVCVTDAGMVSSALAIAGQPEVIFTSFGDMLRVPAGPSSLMICRDAGADVRVVLSPLDALMIARLEPMRQVVFFAVGFETTAPLIASTLQLAAEENIKNFSIIPANKTMPAALNVLLSGAQHINALLCPGHVAAVTGADNFDFVSRELHKPAAIAGFSAVDIMTAVLELVTQSEQGRCELVNCYPRAVSNQGNPHAQDAMEKVFMPCNATWRGLGEISGSGLTLRPEYAEFDATQRFAGIISKSERWSDDPLCNCGAVLRGETVPEKCSLFNCACTPSHPVGACMVSSEGSCAAAYKYRVTR